MKELCRLRVDRVRLLPMILASLKVTAPQQMIIKTLGSVSSDFTWVGPVAKTKGAVNDGQSFDTTPTTFTVTSTALDYYIDYICMQVLPYKGQNLYL